ncbi:hypothetical protein GCAAIG_03520 [Candidatus Electronema halotolerans]
MKTWKLAATLTMSMTMIIAGSAFAQPGTRSQQRFVPLDASRPGIVHHYRPSHPPKVKEHRKAFVVRERPWRQPAASGRMLHRQPFFAIGFTKPLQFVYPSTNYLYIYGVHFR